MDLPQPLRALVRRSTTLLGDVIREEAGTRVYRDVENLRRRMKRVRRAGAREAHRILLRAQRRLRRLSAESQFRIAHAFSAMLELINACENAYRTVRIRAQRSARPESPPQTIVLVLTAHPTEARSTRSILLLGQLQERLVRALEHGFRSEEDALRYLLKLLWRMPMASRSKPSVADEAEHLYSIVLRPEILRTLYGLRQRSILLRLRTWVGGDKDGHPFVDDETFIESLSLSRHRLLRHVGREIEEAASYLPLAELFEGRSRASLRALRRRHRKVREALAGLGTIRPGDGGRIRTFVRRFRDFSGSADRVFGAPVPALARVRSLLSLFPALVVPLEFRESSRELPGTETRGSRRPIARMLRRLARLAAGGEPDWYVRGFVVSMVESERDLLLALRVMRTHLGGLPVPVIPLLETAHALERATDIIGGFMRNAAARRALEGPWQGRLESMLGYSDSAKEMGAFPSRLLIARALRRIDRLVREMGCVPVFFHGTGGSVARGGGSVEEQTEWWPKSARALFKSTVQGEMVQRTFASPEILESQMDKLSARLARSRPVAMNRTDRACLSAFSARVHQAYRRTIESPAFGEVVERATPYGYLGLLAIGSRPVRRQGPARIDSLRAIPWVLCWTQSRTLFPAWWGIGSAWRATPRNERALLRRIFLRHALFSSYVKLLGFTLQKVELPIWRLYLERSGLEPSRARGIAREFEAEFRAAVDFTRSISNRRNLLWFRPWLGTSIGLRSVMIHPLNLLQLAALERRDQRLLRETVTGIASGMLTTG